MANSSMVVYTKLSPHNYGKRTKPITRISPHCVVGQASVEGLGTTFSQSRKASCNYGIGADGRVGMYVEENKAAYCTSSQSNDETAVTIECASDATAPYAFRPVVYERLIDLCVDICKRNGKTKLLWLQTKEKTLAYTPKADEMVLSVHRWFANKSCPGDWMFARMGDLASKVTARLNGIEVTSTTSNPDSKPLQNQSDQYQVRINVAADDVLWVRQGPGTGYKKTASLKRGEVYTIVAESAGKGATKWGKLKSGIGWISLDFTQRK